MYVRATPGQPTDNRSTCAPYFSVLSPPVLLPYADLRGPQVVNFVNTVVGAGVGVGLGLAWGV